MYIIIFHLNMYYHFIVYEMILNLIHFDNTNDNTQNVKYIINY